MPAPTANPTLSFELAPPRLGLAAGSPAATKFWTTARRLMEFHPDFISITYGAGGSSRDAGHHVLNALVRDLPVVPIAHLTCVGASREDVSGVIADFLNSGVRSFLALRGDPPQDQPDWQPEPGGLASAVDLIRLLREIDDQHRANDPGQALREAVHPLSIGVATFPTGNAHSGTNRRQEIARLAEKEAASADFAVTQLFFDADDYLEFLAEARAAGITLPIVPGLIPVTSASQLTKLATLTGTPPPPQFAERLHRYHRPADQYAYGIWHMADVASRVLAAGAPGLHVYTFNKAAPVADFLRAVDHRGLQRRLAKTWPPEL